jgi:hypothetical protein
MTGRCPRRSALRRRAGALHRAVEGAPRPPQQRSPNVDPDDRFDDVRVATAGVSLAPSGPVLASIDVLRGRAVGLWPRAFVDGRAVAVRSWRLVSGMPDVVSATTGAGSDPSVATWLTLPPPDAVFTLRFEVTTDAAPGRVLPASITVNVRAPALVQ